VTFTSAKSEFNDYASDTLGYIASNDWIMNFMDIEWSWRGIFNTLGSIFLDVWRKP